MNGLALPDWSLTLLVVLAVWSTFWKALGLWHAARNKNVSFFVIMAIFNTAGILEIVYLFAILKIKPSKLFKSN